jgi:putative membrane protein
MKTKLLTLSFALVCFSAPCALLANGNDNATVLKDSKITNDDKAFFEKAAKSGEKEVRVSQAVLPQLTNASVKAFAQTMITDHTAANTELKTLASSKGVTLPAPQTNYSEKWSGKDHKEIDEDYIETMVSDHKEAVDLFEKAAKSDDVDIATFASKILPALRHHLETAKTLEKAID